MSKTTRTDAAVPKGSAVLSASAVLADRSGRRRGEVVRSPAGKAVRFVGRSISLVVLVLAALAALVLILVPLVTGSQTYTVLTNSMAPKYAPGTFMVVKPKPFADLRVGDIITYQIESGKPAVISHRIVSVSSTQNGERVFTTKGDNNSLEDEAPVHEVQVRGKLLYAVPYVGFVANAAGQVNRGALVPIGGVALIAFGVFTTIRGAFLKKANRAAA
ncbi:signal peptidase I [Arthrobacter sp. H14-L1]|uniref:signal peptidase I n=1 Tax=Arthrobacter sp. H14-L1 TaxID=2996697 RepID=UPI0022701D19|nr:signal peptidase I [Arthrobacter sp. H14-L1]MCY0905693.1 signal peptidase I [Arthrobacter sp. H14-L1]